MKKYAYFIAAVLLMSVINSCDELPLDSDKSDKSDKENQSEPIINVGTKEAVDLGLSVKWATCNIGADNPEDYGNYYAWGETEPKSTYSLYNYKFYNDSAAEWSEDTYWKYNLKDGKENLDPEDDVARVKWGEDWRMPTKRELKELLNKCTWTWTTQNGVNGYKITSNISGYTDESIFLPAACISLEPYSWMDSISIDFEPNSCGGIMSCEGSLFLSPYAEPYGLFFYEEDSRIPNFVGNSTIRYCGRSVRPVYPLSDDEMQNRDIDTIDVDDFIIDTEEKVIEFSLITGNKQTRSYIMSNSDVADNGGFKVWGFKNTGSPTNFAVFDGVTVNSSDYGKTWTYSPMRYWDRLADYYNFYAAAPAENANGTIAFEDSTICVNNVHYADKSDDDVECMVQRGVKVAYGKNPEKVEFTLSHIMADLIVKIKISDLFDGHPVRLNSLKIVGWNGGSGNFRMNPERSSNADISEWTIPVNSDGELEMVKGNPVILSVDETVIGDYLMIPQSIDENCTVIMNYTIDQEEFEYPIKMNQMFETLYTGQRHVVCINIKPDLISFDADYSIWED